jgi:hypothetical protein
VPDAGTPIGSAACGALAAYLNGINVTIDGSLTVAVPR